MGISEADLNDPDFINSLAKGLAVIEAFGADSPNMTLTRIATKVGLSPGSARRVLVTLNKLGYVDYHLEEKRYSLAARTLQLGYSYLASLPALDLLQPRLAELADKLNESCSIMMRNGKEVVCVARATARRLQRDYMSVGSRFPAHASSSGKVLLGVLTPREFAALYPENEQLPPLTSFTVHDVAALRVQVALAKEQGWICVNQETALGIASVAVPLKVSGKIQYGLSTSATLTRDSSIFVESYLPELHRTAQVMEKLLNSRS
ncbi:MAG: IclR family transcriptional regulator C-terminal domain-containing protein [Pseudomonadota bacterium]